MNNDLNVQLAELAQLAPHFCRRVDEEGDGELSFAWHSWRLQTLERENPLWWDDIHDGRPVPSTSATFLDAFGESKGWWVSTETFQGVTTARILVYPPEEQLDALPVQYKAKDHTRFAALLTATLQALRAEKDVA